MLTIITASSGRGSLIRAMESVISQRGDDEYLISVQGDCPWGHKARNQLIQSARGQFVMFMDDDDKYVPGALDLVRSTLVDGHVNIYQMRYKQENDRVLFVEEEVRIANVSTQMVVAPTEIARQCPFTDHYAGDFDFIQACSQKAPVAWHHNVIAEVRP